MRPSIGTVEFYDFPFFLKNKLLADQPYFVVHPAGHAEHKKWPAEHFLEVCRWILKETDLRLVLAGADKNDPHAGFLEEKLSGHGDRVINLSGKTPLGDLMALLARARGFLSCDSGPAHVASCFGCPSVVIFGRTEPIYGVKRWRPLNDNALIVEHACGDKSFFETNRAYWKRCFASISPERVIGQIQTLLQGRQTA